MNELDLTNTQAVVFMMVFALFKPPRPQKVRSNGARKQETRRKF